MCNSRSDGVMIVIARTESTDQPRSSILYTLQLWRNARLRQPRKYRIAIVQTTDDKSSDQTGSRPHAQDAASHSFQATKVKVAYTGCLADVRFH